MKSVKVVISGAIVSCFLAATLPAQTTTPISTSSATNPGVCDGSGSGRPSTAGKKGYGPGDGTGQKGTRPQDGTGYGARNQFPNGTTGTTGTFGRTQGGSGSRRNNR